MWCRKFVTTYCKDDRLTLGGALFLVLGLLVVFGPVTQHDFVVWDDDLHVYTNPYLNPVTWAHIATFWRGPYEHLYIPLTYTVWAVVAWMTQTGHLGIIPAEPFHRLNLLLHIGSVLVVYRLGLLLLKQQAVPHHQTVMAAILGALVFGLHPLQVEAVAWVSGLKDLLCGWWTVLTLWQYLAFVKSKQGRKRVVHYCLATGAFGCALFSKPTAVAVPVMAALLAIGGLGQTWPQAWRALGSWLLIALGWGIWTKIQQPDVALTFVAALWMRPLIALDAIAFYLSKLVWPVNLVPDYGRTPQLVLEQGRGLITAMVPLGIGALLWYWRARCRGVWLAGGVFLAGVAPMLGLVPFMFQAYSTVADRYAYLAMVGVALGVGWVCQRLGRWPGAWIAAALLMSLLAWCSAQQVPIWRDTTTLLMHTLQVNPESAMAHNNLGLILAQQGRLHDALPSFQRAVRLRPDLAEAHYNLGKALTLLGAFEAAIAHHTTALQYRPGWAEAHNNFGVTLAAQGQHAAALTQYAKALLLKPGWADVYYNMGNVLVQQGRHTEASTAYRAALHSRTVWLPAATSLARLLTTYFASAPEALREAVALAERACHATAYHDAMALYTLAFAYHTAGQSLHAAQTAEIALARATATGNSSLVQEIETLLGAFPQRLSHHEVP
jgi:tetratricopeptide (TPR) repeat protein